MLSIRHYRMNTEINPYVSDPVDFWYHAPVGSCSLVSRAAFSGRTEVGEQVGGGGIRVEVAGRDPGGQRRQGGAVPQ